MIEFKKILGLFKPTVAKFMYAMVVLMAPVFFALLIIVFSLPVLFALGLL